MEFDARISFRIRVAALALLVGIAPATHAVTADLTIQVLDQLDVFSASNVKRSTLSPVTLVDLNSQGSTALRSCQNGRNGLTCLDGQLVRNWPVPKTLPATPATDAGRVLFSCADDALGLDPKGPCTSMTVDVKGRIWIAGRKSSTYHNLIELNRKVNGSCTGTPLTGKVKNVALANTDSLEYCFNIRRAGRPLLLDISAFDGELAPSFRGRGILGVENKKTVVFFPSDGSAIVEIGAGKNDWALAGNEQLLSAALLQREVPAADPEDPSTVYTYGLITTSTGRVLWRNMNAPSGQTATLLANVNSTSSIVTTDPGSGVVSFPRGTLCETGSTANFFEIRASDTTGRLFLSNRNYCKTFVVSPLYSGASIATLGATEIVATASTFRPEGISVSPGIAVDLSRCGATGCDYLNDGIDAGGENAYAAARMIDVTLAPNSATGLIVFHIRNIPDCRKLSITEAPDCDVPGVLVSGPQGVYLNVTPLIPQQVKDLFDTSGVKPLGLPPLLISPKYRAQDENGSYFDALLGITDPAVVFRRSFTAEFDVGDSNLAGQNLGCGVFQAASATPPGPLPFNQWDITTVVSERFSSVGGPRNVVLDLADDPTTPAANDPYYAEHVDMLANKGCFNPTKGAGTRWSMYSYNLELNEDDARGFDFERPRLYLGNLLKSLYLDLYDTQARLACANVDAVGNLPFNPAAPAPLTSSTCLTLKADWDGTKDKLFKCIDAATDPKTSAYDQNCGAFDAQFPGYVSRVRALTPVGADPANRVGELAARLDVILHLYTDHFFDTPLTQAPPAP